MAILTHYQTANLRPFQIERLCRRQFKILRKWQKVIQTGRKHCGKRRNCSLQAISPFPTVFSKDLFSRGVKRCHCVGIDKKIELIIGKVDLYKPFWIKEKMLFTVIFSYSSIFSKGLLVRVKYRPGTHEYS